MENTNWDGVLVLEDMINSRDPKGKALFLEFVSELWDNGFLTKDCVHWLCESKSDSAKVCGSWKLLHQFVSDKGLKELASKI